MKSMMISKDMTVNQAIKLYPSLIPVFNNYNIDTCCGGSDTLEEAAMKGDIDVERFLDEINKMLEGEQ